MMASGSAPATRRLGHISHALRAGSAAGDGDWGQAAPVLPLWPTPEAVPLGELPLGEDPEAWLTMRQEDGTIASPQEAMPQWFKTQPPWVHTWRGKHNPALQVFEPAAGTATGAAVIVAPGGGYRFMAPHEGYTVAKWLAEHGVTAFVLRYRLQPWYQFPAPLLDMQRAVRYVRHHKSKWDLDGRVGILGFSEGGHLVCAASNDLEAAVVGTPDAIDAEDAMADLAIPVCECSVSLAVCLSAPPESDLYLPGACHRSDDRCQLDGSRRDI